MMTRFLPFLRPVLIAGTTVALSSLLLMSTAKPSSADSTDGYWGWDQSGFIGQESTDDPATTSGSTARLTLYSSGPFLTVTSAFNDNPGEGAESASINFPEIYRDVTWYTLTSTVPTQDLQITGYASAGGALAPIATNAATASSSASSVLNASASGSAGQGYSNNSPSGTGGPAIVFPEGNTYRLSGSVAAATTAGDPDTSGDPAQEQETSPEQTTAEASSAFTVSYENVDPRMN